MTLTITARADDGGGFPQRRTQALTRQFHQTKARDATDLHARTICFQRFAQAVLDFALVALRAHVDEVDHDQAADITQAQLTGDFVRCFKIGIECGFLDVRTLGGARRVDVDGYQRFGRVDHNGTAGGQFYFALERRFDL